MNVIDDKELLNYVRQNVEMGIDGIDLIYDHVRSEEFKNSLSKQRDEYNKAFSKADAMLRKKSGEPEDVPVMAKVSTTVMGKMKNLKGQSDSDYAEDMIKGTSMGVAKLIKHQREYRGNDSELNDFVSSLVKFEEESIETIKKYL